MTGQNHALTVLLCSGLNFAGKICGLLILNWNRAASLRGVIFPIIYISASGVGDYYSIICRIIYISTVSIWNYRTQGNCSKPCVFIFAHLIRSPQCTVRILINFRFLRSISQIRRTFCFAKFQALSSRVIFLKIVWSACGENGLSGDPFGCLNACAV